MDIAVGIMIGAEFTAIIASLVDNLANPLIGLFLGRVNFTDMYAVLSGDVPQGTSLDAMRESGAGATVMRLRPGRPGIVGRINPMMSTHWRVISTVGIIARKPFQSVLGQ